MMSDNFDESDFPATDDLIDIKWMPLSLRPKFDGIEELVVAVVAQAGTKVHVEPANCLDRLTCLYGYNAILFEKIILEAIEQISVLATKEDIDKISGKSIRTDNIRSGKVAKGQFSSVSAAAVFWMKHTSSLYREKADIIEFQHNIPVSPGYIPDSTIDNNWITENSSKDKLGDVIYQQIVQVRPTFEKFFSNKIRTGTYKRAKFSAANIQIDFEGSLLAVNFATLKSKYHAKSIDSIKRKLFDLSVDRERQASTLLGRNHEMVIYLPDVDMQTLSAAASGVDSDMISELQNQARGFGLSLKTFRNIKEISAHLLAYEGRSDRQTS